MLVCLQAVGAFVKTGYSMCCTCLWLPGNKGRPSINTQAGEPVVPGRARAGAVGERRRAGRVRPQRLAAAAGRFRRRGAHVNALTAAAARLVAHVNALTAAATALTFVPLFC